ncbi:MAG: rod shape-determining protein MreD [Alphaproteobacteria bacterium]|nr:rod shape-determining protein MreD [Alphaproteobacteria bacterium]MBV9554974.1 rod shape-determining protein MreD [Alphaproteobacteria bacterium]
MALKVFSIPALPRVNNGAARMLPVATMLAAAVISVLPLQIPGYAALTPIFTLMAAYHWTIYRPDLLPPVALFAVGLTEDLLAGSPIGVNALLLLLTRMAVLGYRRYFVNRMFAFVWSGFALLTGVAAVGLWVTHCVLNLTLLDFRNTVIRGALTVAVFPLASFLLGRVQRAVMGAG